jgi:hypothetical protein
MLTIDTATPGISLTVDTDSPLAGALVGTAIVAFGGIATLPEARA